MDQQHGMRISTMAHSVRRALSLGAVLGIMGQQAIVQQAYAQETPATGAPLARVEITGSAIRRIESETALPVQVITREEIEKVGVTTASELLARGRW